jgi:hypothetical protein
MVLQSENHHATYRSHPPPSPDCSPRAAKFRRICVTPEAASDTESFGSDATTLQEAERYDGLPVAPPNDGNLKLPSCNYFDVDETDFPDLEVHSSGYIPVGMNPNDRFGPPWNESSCRSGGSPVFSNDHCRAYWKSAALVEDERETSGYFNGDESISDSSSTTGHSEYSKQKKSASVIGTDQDGDEIEDEDTSQRFSFGVAQDQRGLNKTDSECMQEAIRLSLMDGSEHTLYDGCLEEPAVDVPIGSDDWNQNASAYNEAAGCTGATRTNSLFGIQEIVVPNLLKLSRYDSSTAAYLATGKHSHFLATMESAVVGRESETDEEKEEEEGDEVQGETPASSTRASIGSETGLDISPFDYDLIPDFLGRPTRGIDHDMPITDSELKIIYSTLHIYTPLYKTRDDYGRWVPPQAADEPIGSLLKDILADIYAMRSKFHEGRRDIEGGKGDALIDALECEIASWTNQRQTAPLDSCDCGSSDSREMEARSSTLNGQVEPDQRLNYKI